MGRRGPKPKPTAIKKLQGNPGKRPLNKAEPQPAALDSLDAPAWLGDIGRAKWRELAPPLKTLGLLTAADIDALALLCQAWEEKARCEQVLAEQGEYHMTESGFIVQHPAVARLIKVLERIRKLGADFGLNPSARSGLTIAPQVKAGKLTKFLA